MVLCVVQLEGRKENFYVGPNHFSPGPTQKFSLQNGEKRGENAEACCVIKIPFTFLPCPHSIPRFAAQLFLLSSFVELIFVVLFLLSNYFCCLVLIYKCCCPRSTFFFLAKVFFFFFENAFPAKLTHNRIFVAHKFYIIYNNNKII